MKRLRILFAATALLLLQTAASAADRPMSGVHYAFALGLKTVEERNPGVWGVALSPSQQGMVGEPVASPQTELDVARLDVLQAAGGMPAEAEMWIVFYTANNEQSGGATGHSAVIVEAWRKGEPTGVAFRLPFRMNNGIPEALNGFPFASPENEWV
ncbi:MAG: hypothetical protein ACKVJX_20405 [Verrucomicrobiia bacterium]|jgi:hypothetical protein